LHKAKLVNLNTMQNQPHNHPLAPPVQKWTNSQVCLSTWSTLAHMRHVVNEGGRDSHDDMTHRRAVNQL